METHILRCRLRTGTPTLPPHSIGQSRSYSETQGPMAGTYAPPTVGRSLQNHMALNMNRGKGEELGPMTPLTTGRYYSSHFPEEAADVREVKPLDLSHTARQPQI